LADVARFASPVARSTVVIAAAKRCLEIASTISRAEDTEGVLRARHEGAINERDSRKLCCADLSCFVVLHAHKKRFTSRRREVA